MKPFTLKQAFLGWLAVSVTLLLLLFLWNPLVHMLYRVRDAAVRAEVSLASYFRMAEPAPITKPKFRQAGYFIAGIPAHNPVGIFPMDRDEPLQSVYEAMAWVHQRGGGVVQVEPGSLRRGKRVAYFGCDESRGGKCFPDVYVTVKR